MRENMSNNCQVENYFELATSSSATRRIKVVYVTISTMLDIKFHKNTYKSFSVIFL